MQAGLRRDDEIGRQRQCAGEGAVKKGLGGEQFGGERGTLARRRPNPGAEFVEPDQAGKGAGKDQAGIEGAEVV